MVLGTTGTERLSTSQNYYNMGRGRVKSQLHEELPALIDGL